MKNIFKYRIANIPVTFVMGMFVLLSLLSACENDLDNVKKVTATDETPQQITAGLHTLYSDSGIVQYEIIANRVEIFEVPKQKTIFKNGFVVNYFDKNSKLVSKLKADYGEIKQQSHIIIARNNVIFTNYEKNQTLKTEELFWDQATKKVRTEKNFFVESPTTYAKGVGLEADETFSNYSMSNFSLTYKDTINESSKTE